VPLSDAMARLVGPRRPPLGLLCEPHPGSSGWDALHAASQDPFNPTHINLPLQVLLGRDTVA
jgi:hypothetical protein